MLRLIILDPVIKLKLGVTLIDESAESAESTGSAPIQPTNYCIGHIRAQIAVDSRQSISAC